MKRLITLCLIVVGLLVSQDSVNAQLLPPPPGFPPPPKGSMPAEDPAPRPLEDQRVPFELNSRRIQEPRVIKKGLLAPDASDVAQHKFLLSQKNTGMMRLLPREDFDWGMYKVPKQIDKRGGGSYFSFYYRSHEYGYGSDIGYEKGFLRVGFAGADYGMLTDLGDTPLEPITAEDPKAAFLLNYKPPRKEKDARIEAQKFGPIYTRGRWSGFIVDGVPYFKRVGAVVNHTYLLRSIAYDTSDVLVAFRVVKIADDGGLTIAWKILKEFGTPKLKRDFR